MPRDSHCMVWRIMETTALLSLIFQVIIHLSVIDLCLASQSGSLEVDFI